MKKTFFITIMMIAFGIIHGYGQGTPLYPIPSYNITVNGFANFQENTLSQTHVQPAEKRMLYVEVKTPSTSSDCQAGFARSFSGLPLRDRTTSSSSAIAINAVLPSKNHGFVSRVFPRSSNAFRFCLANRAFNHFARVSCASSAFVTHPSAAASRRTPSQAWRATAQSRAKRGAARPRPHLLSRSITRRSNRLCRTSPQMLSSRRPLVP